MKAAAVTASLLLAGSVSAVVPATLRQKMQARRAESKRHNNIGTKNNWKTGNPLAVGYKDMDDRIVTSNSSSKATYDSNWAGAVTTTTGVTQVQGTWTVPQGNTPPGGDSDSYGAAIWVGIDGDSCQSAILQTGISMNIQSGSASYSGWYEWFPDASYAFSGFNVSPGDQISASVIATSAVSGTATLDNLSTGQSVRHTFSNMGSVGSLCMTDAEWIVEDFEENGALVPFADFGDVVISSASYQAGGSTYGVSGSTTLDVQESNGDVVTNCGTSGSNAVSCQYSGSS